MLLINRNVQRPTYHAINNLGRSVLKSLFESRYGDYRIKYDKNDIIQLLNYIGSRVSNDVNDMKFRWGDALLSLSSSKKAVHDIGVRGNALKHHNKQAIISSHVVLDENYNCINRGWIKDLCLLLCATQQFFMQPETL